MNSNAFKILVRKIEENIHIWDPLQLAGERGADWTLAKEYEKYISHLAGMILKGLSKTEITEYLLQVERDFMGISADEARIEAFLESVL